MDKIPVDRHDLSHGWSLFVLPHGAESPMENHGALEISADDLGKRFYAYEIFVACYGLTSVSKACTDYINMREGK